MRSLVHRVVLAAVVGVCALVGVLVFASGPALAAAPEAPEVTVEAPVRATEAVVRGVLNPGKEGEPGTFEVGTYEFLYKASEAKECGGGSVAPASPGMSLGSGKEAVAEVLTSLAPGTEYAVCLRVVTAGGEATSLPVTFKTAVPPEAPETTAASEVGSSTAKLNGVLNPNHAGEPGKYEFLYRRSKTECQGESATAAREANGLSPEQVPGEEVGGLLPGTHYTFCLLAINAAGESALGNPVSFATAAVAPTVGEEFVTGVSSGSATLHGVVNPGGADTTYRFEYGPTASYGKALSGDAGAGIEGVAVSAHPVDLAPGVLYHYRLVAGNEAGQEVAGPDQTLTTQPVAGTPALPDGRMWEMVSPLDKNGAEVSNLKTANGGDFQAAEDGEAVTYITSAPITTDTRGNPWEPQVLSTRGPDGWRSEDINTPHDGSSDQEFKEFGVGTDAFRNGEYEEYVVFSPDLSRAFVQPEGHTPLVPGQPAPEYEELANGERTEHLVGGYVRDNVTGTFSLSPLRPSEWYAEQAAGVQAPPSCDASSSPAGGVGVDAVSRDGCYVYFNSEAALAPGATGTDPLYVSHYEGGGWTTTFISSLSGTGAPEWPGKDVEHEPGGKYVELSPDGRYVAFMSNLRLTGFDNRDAKSGQRDEEVYLYDAASNHLVCPSCNRNGTRPAGQLDNTNVSGFGGVLVDSNSFWAGSWLAGVLPEWQLEGFHGKFHGAALYQPRYLSDSGRLFFDSSDALVPQDVNDLEDVYEYEPEGVGSCGSAAGCVSLISSGTSGSESAFVDASTDGGDAFFMTRSGLIPEDEDNSFDIYDAHVCTVSVPCRPVPVSPPACETSDSCKAPPTPQPGAFGAPASATFVGSGNVVRSESGTHAVKKKAAKCPGSRRRSHGRCVKRSRVKRKPAKGGK